MSEATDRLAKLKLLLAQEKVVREKLILRGIAMIIRLMLSQRHDTGMDEIKLVEEIEREIK